MAGTITHSWNGTVLTVTSDSGTSSADLQGAIGIRGPQGIAGVKGVSPIIDVEVNDTGVSNLLITDGHGTKRVQLAESTALFTVDKDFSTESDNAIANSTVKKEFNKLSTEFNESGTEVHCLPIADTLLNIGIQGRTLETGEGDKSPDNPYIITGVDSGNVLVENATEAYTYNLGVNETLYGNDEIYDSVENYASIGCDKKIILDGSGYWRLHTSAPVMNGTRLYQLDFSAKTVGNYITGSGLSNRYNNVGGGSTVWTAPNESYCIFHTAADERFIRVRSKATTIEEFQAELAANPLTVYYRSTNYKADNDIKVKKITKRYGVSIIDGGEEWEFYRSSYSVFQGKYGARGAKGAAGSVVANANCDKYTVASNYTVYDGNTGNISLIENGNVRLCDTNYTTVEDLTAMLAENPITLVYELATPEIYATEPDTIINALSGENIITGDGNVVSAGGITYIPYAVEVLEERIVALESRIDELATAIVALGG